ncbi:MAG: glycosyltransferase family 1 protein [Thermoleophilia bacterium]
MRVGFDARTIDASGIGTYTRNLLLRLARADADFVIFSRDVSKSLVPQGPRFTLVSVNADPTSWTGGTAFRRAAAEAGIDLLHVPGHLTTIPEDILTVTTVHDVIPLIYPRSIRNPLGRVHYRRRLHQAVERSAVLITVSRISQSTLTAYAGVDPHRVRVIYNGVSEQFHPVADAEELASVRRRYALPDRFALWIGDFRPEKNLEFLVQSWALVRGRVDPDLHLVMAGTQSGEFFKIRREVVRRGLESQIHFPGYIRDDDLAALYSAAEMFVFPSLYEGFGLPPLEAMACGTPCVVSNSSALPEVTGRAAMMFNPTEHDQLVECVKRVLSDQTLNSNLRKEGFAQAAKFSWEQAAAETLEVYAQVLGLEGGPSPGGSGRGGPSLGGSGHGGP